MHQNNNSNVNIVKFWLFSNPADMLINTYRYVCYLFSNCLVDDLWRMHTYRLQNDIFRLYTYFLHKRLPYNLSKMTAQKAFISKCTVFALQDIFKHLKYVSAKSVHLQMHTFCAAKYFQTPEICQRKKCLSLDAHFLHWIIFWNNWKC